MHTTASRLRLKHGGASRIFFSHVGFVGSLAAKSVLGRSGDILGRKYGGKVHADIPWTNKLRPGNMGGKTSCTKR